MSYSTEEQRIAHIERVTAMGHANRRHGHVLAGKKSATYQSWSTARGRCNNPRDPSFARYGGSGITMCARWAAFDVFLQDMGERPDGATLDRIDPLGNYEPGNCRWLSVAEQNRNTRSNVATWPIVRSIRAEHAAGASCTSLGEKYGMTRSNVEFIVAGKSWPASEDPGRMNPKARTQ